MLKAQVYRGVTEDATHVALDTESCEYGHNGYSDMVFGWLNKQERQELVADLEQIIQQLSYDFEDESEG